MSILNPTDELIHIHKDRCEIPFILAGSDGHRVRDEGLKAGSLGGSHTMYPSLIFHFCQFAAAGIYGCLIRNSGTEAFHAKMHE